MAMIRDLRRDWRRWTDAERASVVVFVAVLLLIGIPAVISTTFF
jgi:hypothetical protein